MRHISHVSMSGHIETHLGGWWHAVAGKVDIGLFAGAGVAARLDVSLTIGIGHVDVEHELADDTLARGSVCRGEAASEVRRALGRPELDERRLAERALVLNVDACDVARCGLVRCALVRRIGRYDLRDALHGGLLLSAPHYDDARAIAAERGGR